MRVQQDRRHSTARAKAQAERDAKIITPKLTAELEATTRTAFADAQSKVHTLSGALLASGRLVTDVRDHGETWLAYMIWGGTPATEHAIYEAAEGGTHDWLRDSHVYSDAIEAVIESNIREHLR